MSMDSKQSPSSPPVRALGDHFETALDRAARAAEPPDYDQLAAYVDGTLDDVDREIVESWLESDPALRAEVADLRALHEAMTVSAAAPAATPSVSSAPPASSAPTVPSARSMSSAPFTPSAAPPPSAPSAAAASGRLAASAPSASTAPSVPSASSGVLPFEPQRSTKSGGRSTRFGTATVIMGAMAAAVIGAVTWMAVRTARVNDAGPGAGAAGSQVASRQPGQPGQSGQPGQPEQAPPVQSRGSGGAPQVAANPRQGAAEAMHEAVAVRDAGGAIAIDAAGAVTGLTADAATASMTQLVADALTKGTLPPSAAAAALGDRSELTLMGRSRQAPATRLAPLSPIATVVRTARPVFRWSAHPGARGYVVTIYGPDFDHVLSSPTLTGTTWTSTSALKPGVTYQWQVTADTPEGSVRAPAPPAPDARFRIIDAAAAKALDRDLARAGSSQLMKGLLLAQAGILDEAEQAFEALQAENPESKRVAELLARVRDRRLSP